MLLKVLVPEIVIYSWSDETLGDIVEAMLATGMRTHLWPALRAIAMYLDYAVGLLYTIRCRFPQVHTTNDLIELMNKAKQLPDLRTGHGELELNQMD